MTDRIKITKLPNWNNKIFLEISGIDVEKELRLNETDENYSKRQILMDNLEKKFLEIQKEINILKKRTGE